MGFRHSNFGEVLDICGDWGPCSWLFEGYTGNSNLDQVCMLNPKPPTLNTLPQTSLEPCNPRVKGLARLFRGSKLFWGEKQKFSSFEQYVHDVDFGW